MMHCYARLLAHYPYVVIAAVTLLVTAACIVISLSVRQLPDFQDPKMGFEPRGTVLAQRETAWNNLLKATKPSGPLTTDPNEEQRRLLALKSHRTLSSLTRSSRRKPTITAITTTREPMLQVDVNSSSKLNENLTLFVSSLPRLPPVDVDPPPKIYVENGGGDDDFGKFEMVEEDRRLPNDTTDDFFCGQPLENYAHVVFRSTDDTSLFTVDALKSMCALEEAILRRAPDFEDLCETNRHGQCCRSWSLGNYVALLRNRTSCRAIRDEDVRSVYRTLKVCSRYYYDLQLQSDCEERWCRGIQAECFRHNAVYHMIHFLMDSDFLNPDQPNNATLTYAMVFLPIACSHSALPYFKSLEGVSLADDHTRVVAMEFGLKNALFDEYLISDTVFIGMAAGVIVLAMWMYTSSFFVTVMTVIAIFFSLVIAYFVYTVVFNIRFFPFMNLLTVVIIIGIGADDAFIYCRVWACAKSEKNNGTLVKLVNDTLKSAMLSMFVTSLTTAAAFFASYVSSITAIRCFSVFAGTTVLANFVLTVTWLPATVVIAEKWCSSNLCICIPPFGLYAPQLQRHRYCSKLCNALWKLHYRFTDWAAVFFEKILPCVVIKPRYVWVALLGCLAVIGVVLIFGYPRLHLPDSLQFQIFASDHPFEQYDFVFKGLFWFEKVKNADLLSKLPIRIVWGVRPVDTGDYLDPLDKGDVVFDPTFDLAAPASQRWLLEFCRRLRNQSFYQPMWGPLLPNCFIETFISWMDRRCVDTISDRDRSPCCERSRFPYSEGVFNLCMKRAMEVLYATPSLYFLPDMTGPRFSKNSGRIAAMVIEYDSTYSFTFSYNEMRRFVTQVEDWVLSEMELAPKGMRNGWFISYVDTYDLQDSLARGTVVAIGVALTISAIVLFLTTLNVLVTIYAIVTIACVIFVTIGSLVLLGWKLNVLESVTVSVAIGLAVDFTLHYGVVYKQSVEADRESAVVFSIARMGSPIAMAAFTTFLAGLFMLPSSVLGYIQIGTFVMIVMATSWIYSTLFFQSLLRIAGPQNRFGQCSYPSLDCCSASNVVDKTVYSYALSESTMSTSSIVGFPVASNNPNESHELEPLTVLGKFPDHPATVGNRRYIKHKSNQQSKGSVRQRSGSLSVVSCDGEAAYRVARRKVSLPTGAIDRSPRHMPVTTSSTTMVFADDVDREQGCV